MFFNQMCCILNINIVLDISFFSLFVSTCNDGDQIHNRFMNKFVNKKQKIIMVMGYNTKATLIEL